MKRKLPLVRNMFAVLFLLGSFSMAALAHNHLLKTEPSGSASLQSAPQHIVLWFQETPDLTVTKLEVKGPAGAVDLGPVHLMPNNSIMADVKGKLPTGQYVVTWQTAGDDGHVSRGDFTFNVVGQ